MESLIHHPWGEFLASRLRCLYWLEQEGHSDEVIARELSIDLVQVKAMAAAGRARRIPLHPHSPAGDKAWTRSECDLLERMLGQLRLRGHVLVAIGHDTQADREDIERSFGAAFLSAASRHAFTLNEAPLASAQIDAVRTAFNNGQSRW